MTEEDEEFERIQRRIEFETRPLNFTKQKKWIGLTKDEQLDIFLESIVKNRSEYQLYKAIEKALKEKNYDRRN
jgi:hypothetical protein